MTQNNDLFDGEPQSNGTPSTVKKTRSAQRSRAGKSLPTDRMKFEVQLKCLIKYGSLSGPEKKPITAEDVSRAMEKAVSHYTAPLSNGFFTDAGWLEKRGKGEYVASDALIEYGRRLATNRDDARAVRPLREAASDAWFWHTIKSRLDHSTTVEESDLLYVLMSEAGASSDHLPQLRNLLEWVEYVGLIQRNDGVVRLVSNENAVNLDVPLAYKVQNRTDEESKSNGEPSQPVGTGVPSTPPTTPTPTPPPATPAQAPAVLTFDVSVRVTAEDLAKLDPEQIQALFAAVGTVMSASSNRV